MGKNTIFSGQPIFNQLLTFIDKSEIRKIAKKHGSEYYVKKFTTYNHLVVMLFVVFEGYHSIREVILGLLANAHKLSHLGLSYLVRRSTFSEANKRRTSKVFEDIYMIVYQKHSRFLADSRLTDKDLKRLYIMDSSTISLFKDILKGVGRNPKGDGKKKGGLKVHMAIDAVQSIGRFVKITAAKVHDKNFLKSLDLMSHSMIVFDKAYNYYHQFALWTEQQVYFVTRLKKNAVYEVIELTRNHYRKKGQAKVLSDEVIELTYHPEDENGKRQLKIFKKIFQWFSMRKSGNM